MVVVAVDFATKGTIFAWVGTAGIVDAFAVLARVALLTNAPTRKW